MEPWKRVAQAVRNRRLYLGWTQQEASDRARVSLATWRLIESAGRDRYQDLTLRGVSRALGWSANTFDTIIAGGDAPSDEEADAPWERPTPSASSRSDGTIPSGFARKYLELTSDEQAMVQGYVEGLAARHER